MFTVFTQTQSEINYQKIEEQNHESFINKQEIEKLRQSNEDLDERNEATLKALKQSIDQYYIDNEICLLKLIFILKHLIILLIVLILKTMINKEWPI